LLLDRSSGAVGLIPLNSAWCGIERLFGLVKVVLFSAVENERRVSFPIRSVVFGGESRDIGILQSLNDIL